MEALDRKPNLSARKSMTMDDGTKIEVYGIVARKSMEISNNKKLSDADRGIHITAAKIRVDDKPVVYDDLVNCFTDDELITIVAFANEIKEGDDDQGNP